MDCAIVVVEQNFPLDRDTISLPLNPASCKSETQVY